MCAPSTSASQVIIILWYLALIMLKSLPIPVPIAVARVIISRLLKILWSRAFSTFRIFPRRGSMAWYSLFLPCLLLPPALSPSTT